MDTNYSSTRQEDLEGIIMVLIRRTKRRNQKRSGHDGEPQPLREAKRQGKRKQIKFSEG